MEKRATLADVARRAGVSVGAVSQVLTRRPDSRVAQAARERILKAAAELDYRPNVQAQSLRTSKTQTIALISDSVTTQRYASGMVRGVVREADESDHVAFVFETEGLAQRATRALNAALDRQVDGIIFAFTRARDIELPDVPTTVPTVVLNGRSPGPVASVLPDEVAGGRSVSALLGREGVHEGVLLLGHGPYPEPQHEHSFLVTRRHQGLLEGAAESHIGLVDQVPLAQWEPDAGRAAMVRSLARHGDNIRAVISMNDRIAFGVYGALARSGRRIPSDVRVVSFDDDEVASYLEPALTTVALPYEEMGRTAVKLLLEPGRTGELLVPMSLRERDSLGSRSDR